MASWKVYIFVAKNYQIEICIIISPRRVTFARVFKWAEEKIAWYGFETVLSNFIIWFGSQITSV